MSSICLADFGLSKLRDGPKGGACGVWRTRTPVPISSDDFRAVGEMVPLSAKGRLLNSNERDITVIDDWWGVYFTLQRLCDTECELPWQSIPNEKFSELNIAKTRALFGKECNTKGEVREAVMSGCSSWRHRDTLPVELFPFFDVFFDVLLETELGAGSFSRKQALVICEAASKIE